ncbi:crotonyl-CoA carboxylase/reductase [Amycolatopsis sp. NPDC059657]|uniref:crotonyl-CoA carboxylase/reductase n=1 Tax=Amycolatopsis sp. NPDC059657 TaxID=3346899 RepID=UPI0036733E2B
MDTMREALIGDAGPEDIRRLDVPADYRAAFLRIEDTSMFDGVADRDVRKSLHVGTVPMPELAPDEVLVAVMASAVNYNTVWSAMFSPIPTFRFLRQFAREGGWASRHDLPQHVVGSDGAGIIVRVGAGVRRWQVGDHVAIHPVQVDDQEHATHDDAMMGAEQRAWGFETNFGGLADYTVVRASQLLPKPAHLTWEEAAVNTLCASTAYRMLVGSHGARLKQGDVVLIWGAAGGLGSYAIQMVKNGGGTPIGVVSSERKAEAARRLGCDIVIDRNEIGLTGDVSDDPQQVIEVGKRLGRQIRAEVGRDPDIVFEHTGRATFGVSVFVVRRGGIVVTCGSSSGYQHTYDNRYLWMKLKTVMGSHGANLQESLECTRLIADGRIMPVMSAAYPLAEVGEACRLVQTNQQIGKVAVLCMAPSAGLGVTDAALRDRIGNDRLMPLMDIS